MVEDEQDRWVCHLCIGEAFLKAEIKRAALRQTCSFCDKKAASIALGELAGRVERVFEDHYLPTARDPDGFEYAMHKDPEINYTWYRSGEDVATTIAEMLEADEPVAAAVQECLADRQSLDDQAIGEEDPFGDEAHYTERGPDDEKYRALWTGFETSLRTQSRFYNAQAKALFDEIFKDIDSLKSDDGTPAVTTAMPESFPPFFRARLAYDERAVHRYLKDPERELGSPPSASAKSGRMNASGISVFYGAFEVETCVAELRPPVGAHVVAARFSITRKLRLLDLDVMTALSVKGSHFDPGHRERLDRVAFLRSLHAHATRPTMPGEEELGYLPTQAFAEYLANVANPTFDGLLFRSTQTGNVGRNIVLLDTAALLAPASVRTTDVHRYFGDPDEPEDELTIEEQAVSTATSGDAQARHPFFTGDFEGLLSRHSGVERTPATSPSLKLDRDGLTVLDVHACDYRTSAQTVKRVVAQPRPATSVQHDIDF